MPDPSISRWRLGSARTAKISCGPAGIRLDTDTRATSTMVHSSCPSGLSPVETNEGSQSHRAQESRSPAPQRRSTWTGRQCPVLLGAGGGATRPKRSAYSGTRQVRTGCKPSLATAGTSRTPGTPRPPEVPASSRQRPQLPPEPDPFQRHQSRRDSQKSITLQPPSVGPDEWKMRPFGGSPAMTSLCTASNSFCVTPTRFVWIRTVTVDTSPWSPSSPLYVEDAFFARAHLRLRRCAVQR